MLGLQGGSVSNQGQVGAEAAAREMIKFIEALVALPTFAERSPHEVADIIKAKAEQIESAAKSGWF